MEDVTQQVPQESSEVLEARKEFTTHCAYLGNAFHQLKSWESIVNTHLQNADATEKKIQQLLKSKKVEASDAQA